MLQKILGKIKAGCSSCESCPDGQDENKSEEVKGLCFERLHQEEKNQLIKLLKQTGRILSREEMAIVDEFLSHEGHISPDFIIQRLEEQGQKADPHEVEDALNLLCRYGLAQKVNLNGTGPWYEHLHLGEKHDHLLCTRCGKVVEFEDEEFKRQMKKSASLHGFQPLFQKTTIYGICEKCKRKQSGTLPLSALSVGERALIIDLAGGSKLKKKLSDMGLVINEKVEVLGKTGPIILSVKGSRIAVGMGIAQKILVCPILPERENLNK